MTEAEKIGEVLEACTTSFTAQCYELHQPPSFGSLVRTKEGDIELYGLVYHATTSGLEPGRRPVARGRDEENEEAVFRTSPQLLKLLKSEFGIIKDGHRQDSEIRHYLPPRPAHIHSFVYICRPEEVRQFSHSLNFLNIIIGSSLELPTDELIAAALRQMSRQHKDGQGFLMAASKQLATRLSGDYGRLKSILERLKV